MIFCLKEEVCVCVCVCVWLCVYVHMDMHVCMSAIMYVNELRKEDKRRNCLRLMFLNFSFFFLCWST